MAGADGGLRCMKIVERQTRLVCHDQIAMARYGIILA